MVNKLERLSQVAVTELLTKLETKLDADVFTYYGEIVNGVERNVKDIIEALAKDPNKHQAIYVFLTTPGGSLTPVQRMVDILRHFYSEVNFIVPDYAYSAGTIWCMSGDNIYMNYYSSLGPIDPQVQSKDGKLVAALGYLDKIPVCVGYEIDGEVTNTFPTTDKLNRAKPVLEVLDGWKEDIRGIKEYDELPENCRKYIEFVEKQIGFPITMISNGPGRNDIIYRNK